MTLKPKEMELSMQSSYADDKWNVTLQAWISTKSAATALINILQIARDILPDTLDAPAETLSSRICDCCDPPSAEPMFCGCERNAVPRG